MTTLKSITLHRAATDNTGAFKDAGAELTVGDENKPDVISADRAREILDAHGATGHHHKQTGEKPKATKPRTKKPATKKPAAPKVPAAPAPVVPPAAPVEPVNSASDRE